VIDERISLIGTGASLHDHPVGKERALVDEDAPVELAM
jgi:hypothetical protein